MKRFLQLCIAICLTSLYAQDPPAPPVPAPEPQQQPSQPPPQPSQPSPQEVREQRERSEALRAEEEAQRQKFVDSLKSPDPDTRLITPPETCLSLAGPADREFDLESIPLTGWLALGQTTGVPWRAQIGSPMLRMDQRYEIPLSARLAAKDFKHLQVGDQLLFVSGVSSPDGRWLTTPKVRRQTLTREFVQDSFISYAECVFVRPGDYVVWLAFYNPKTQNHNLITRRIRVAEARNNPLPRLSADLPDAEFPEGDSNNAKVVRAAPGRLFLPVRNAKPLVVDLISIVNPPEQWSDRLEIVESHTSKVLTAVGVLSQMTLTNGSISATAIDLVNRVAPFEQHNLGSLDWKTLAAAFSNVDGHTISRSALESFKDRGAFFRASMQERLKNPGESMRIAIVVSSSMVFERGSDLTPLERQTDCNCRLYHLRFRHNRADFFDDLEKVMKPVHPKTFNVTSPLEFRQALAEIIRDLERL